MRKHNLLQREEMLRRMQSVVERVRSTANRDGIDSATKTHGNGRKVPTNLSFDEAMRQLYGVDTLKTLPDEPEGPCEQAAAKARVVCIGGGAKQAIDRAGNYPYEYMDRYSPGCCAGYAFDQIPGSHGPYMYCYKV
jgi:hypothetical protein